MISALETLRRDFGGGIIEPGGAEYGSASRSLLASGKPAHVLRPQSVEDVSTTPGICSPATTTLGRIRPWRTSTAADVTAEPLGHGPPDHGRSNLAVSVAPSQSGIPSLTWSTGM
jgi:hypothetical protein